MSDFRQDSNLEADNYVDWSLMNSRLDSFHGSSLAQQVSAERLSWVGFNEELEDMEFRLRTGEVIDESTYPMAPQMKSEDARLQTFSSWPSDVPVRPRDLAQAGLFYLREGDQVQCFCCGGMLAGWEAGDTAWGEHSEHFPHCFFILGHDVGNIPSQGTNKEEEERTQHISPRFPMESFEERLNTFAGIQHPIDHERLARAGFYSIGMIQTPE